MQKIVNVLAVSSAVVSLAVVGSVGYLYVNRTAIIEDIKEKAMESVMGGGLGGGLGGDLPIGTPDLAPPAGQAAAPFAGENAAAGGTSAFEF
tara:strand:+ start:608 stop:883 length:276 start_codon:yes stop_codon:yes gene_type:complete